MGRTDIVRSDLRCGPSIMWIFLSDMGDGTCASILVRMATETTPKTEQIPEYLPRERPPGIPLLKLIASDGTVVIDETKWRKNPAYSASSVVPVSTTKPVPSL